MFSWKKHGKIFDPVRSRPRPWMLEYAQCPFPFVLNKKILRVYITSRGQRDANNQYLSIPTYVDLDRGNITHVVKTADAPLMPMGNAGAFDEFGITPTSFVRRDGEIYAFYTGWTRMQSVPYTMAIGIAVSRNGGETFDRLGEGPILGPTLNEPFVISGPIVHIIEDQWHMWYLTGRKWLRIGNKSEPVYQIAHATSTNGIVWNRNGIPIIETLSEDECQVSFALFFLRDKWHAIFAYRHPVGFRVDPSLGYRLGYATSRDLANWERDDSQIGIDVSESGWDSCMMCYPQIIELDGRLLLFYCGNDFGRDGFGVAEMTNYSATL